MVSVVRSSDTSHDTLGALSNVPLSKNTLQNSSASVPWGDYKIVYKQQSECALILFSQHTQTSECFVIKLLREYKDTRYSLKTLAERQLCQLEAVRQNREFTPDIHLGLARVEALDLEKMSIFIDGFIKDPVQEMLDKESEYALIMKQLPADRRVDCLLQESAEPVQQDYIQLLALQVFSMHMHKKHFANSLSNKDEELWGGAEQLERKLQHNFHLLDLVLTIDENECSKAWNRLESRLTVLKEALYDAFTQWQSCGYFEQRVAEQRIKRCHGDLKSPNMWIMPKGQWHSKKAQVLVLDAADFNPSYTHIDILSDVALLAVDIQARTRSSSLANLFIQNYLHYTEQQDRVSEAVLAYYLVEKAIVGAAVSIVYDNLSDLGLAFLETAEMRLRSLQGGRSDQSFMAFSRSR